MYIIFTICIHTHTQGRVELVCDVPLSRVNTSLLDHSSIPVQLPEHNLAKFMDHPPDHAYLPPIPNHTPKLMCQEALGRAIKKGSALVSVDSLLPYQVCVSPYVQYGLCVHGNGRYYVHVVLW